MSANGDNKATIDCPSCKQRFSTPMPKTGVMNDLRCSVAFGTHEKPVRCICGKYSVFVATSAEIAWAVIPISDEQAAQLQDSSIIVPPMVIN